MTSKRRRTVTEECGWFSVKGLLKHTFPKDDRRHRRDRYEESIIVLRASSEDEAAELAVKLFKEQEYADEDGGIVFTGAHEVCPLFDPVREGHEVYWFLRISNLSPQKYVAKYWDDDGRPESCDDKGWTHSWYNFDGKSSRCMNCREQRKGRLWKRKETGSSGAKRKSHQ